MKKIFGIIGVAILLITLSGMTAYQEETDFSQDELVILYRVGNCDITVQAEESKVLNYTSTGEWAEVPSQRMYAPDGRTEIINIVDVESWKAVGWYEYPVKTMYTPDGRQSNVAITLVEEWINVGWYEYPVTYMYSPDGRVAIIATTDVQAWKSVGWFETYEESQPTIFTYEVFTKSNLSVEQLNKILSGTGLAGYGQAFYNMEQTYGVSSLYAISVGAHESANFYKKANTHNYFGFRGNKGWMAFSSPEECIMYFGKLMNKPMYKGKTIEQIAQIYCNPPQHWINSVKAHMREKWNKL